MKINVIGGGLCGVEACYQLLKRGVNVTLYEMRPKQMTPCHTTGNLAELVCSNSLKSLDVASASGLLKAEMEVLDSIVIKCAKKTAVPAGSALAVDRVAFSKEIENCLKSFNNFKIVNEEVVTLNLNEVNIVASGPLTSDKLFESLKNLFSTQYLHFFDAVSPIIDAESVDMQSAFFASRYNKGDKFDYLNCPLTLEEYEAFYSSLINAECVKIKDFENNNVFEGCMPVEVMAMRGKDTLRFGPMKPVGIYDENNKRPYAVVQLRKENSAGSMYNIVGFQTHLTFKAQKEVFSLIPALKNAEFLRYGVMHRNTFINSPTLLNEFLQAKQQPNLFFGGQMVGVEGYNESAMCGLFAGINAYNYLNSKPLTLPSDDTISGSLLRYVANANPQNFQPMNANFGLLKPLDIKIKDKQLRKKEFANRALNDIIIYNNNLKGVANE